MLSYNTYIGTSIIMFKDINLIQSPSNIKTQHHELKSNTHLFQLSREQLHK